MRTLTKRQKKLLDIWFEENKEELLDIWFKENKEKLLKNKEIFCFDVNECRLFPYELYQKLIDLNDTEILYQEINRYVSDKGIKASFSSFKFKDI